MEKIRIKYFTDKIEKLDYIEGNPTGSMCALRRRSHSMQEILL